MSPNKYHRENGDPASQVMWLARVIGFIGGHSTRALVAGWRRYENSMIRFDSSSLALSSQHVQVRKMASQQSKKENL